MSNCDGRVRPLRLVAFPRVALCWQDEAILHSPVARLVIIGTDIAEAYRTVAMCCALLRCLTFMSSFNFMAILCPGAPSIHSQCSPGWRRPCIALKDVISCKCQLQGQPRHPRRPFGRSLPLTVPLPRLTPVRNDTFMGSLTCRLSLPFSSVLSRKPHLLRTLQSIQPKIRSVPELHPELGLVIEQKAINMILISEGSSGE